MQFPKQCKVHKCAAVENTVRYAICGVYLDTDDDGPSLVATDGHKLAVVPVDNADGDKSAIVPADVVKAACKGGKSTPAEIAVNGSVRVAGKGSEFTEFEAIEGQFPKWRDVVPKYEGETVKIGLNARYLADIAEAFGWDSVVIEFARKPQGYTDKAYTVRPVCPDKGEQPPAPDAYAVLMPVDLDS